MMLLYHTWKQCEGNVFEINTVRTIQERVQQSCIILHSKINKKGIILHSKITKRENNMSLSWDTLISILT